MLQQGDRVAKRSPPGATGSEKPDLGTSEDWVTGHLRRVRNEASREEVPLRMRQLLDQLDRLEEPEEDDPP